MITDTKYSLPGPEKDQIGHKLAGFIDRELDEVVAAYLFGSFIGGGRFSDIDLGLLFKSKVSEVLGFELALETRLNKLFGH